MLNMPAPQVIVFLLSQGKRLLPGFLRQTAEIYVSNGHHARLPRLGRLVIVEREVEIAVRISAHKRCDTITSVNIFFIKKRRLLLSLQTLTTGTAKSRMRR